MIKSDAVFDVISGMIPVDTHLIPITGYCGTKGWRGRVKNTKLVYWWQKKRC